MSRSQVPAAGGQEVNIREVQQLKSAFDSSSRTRLPGVFPPGHLAQAVCRNRGGRSRNEDS